MVFDEIYPETLIEIRGSDIEVRHPSPASESRQLSEPEESDDDCPTPRQQDFRINEKSGESEGGPAESSNEEGDEPWRTPVAFTRRWVQSYPPATRRAILSDTDAETSKMEANKTMKKKNDSKVVTVRKFTHVCLFVDGIDLMGLPKTESGFGRWTQMVCSELLSHGGNND
jgi:hypothetical protein